MSSTLYKCDVCGKEYENFVSLQTHRRLAKHG